MKFKLYNTIPLNIFLSGNKNWSRNKADISKYKSFYYKAIYRIPRKYMIKVKEEELKNKEVRIILIGISGFLGTYRHC